MRSRLEEAILSALAYHDLFGFPLTAEEIRLALPRLEGSAPRLEDVVRALAVLAAAGASGTRDGFHFLPGRERIVDDRRARYVIAERKFAIVRRFLLAARFAPWLRAVFVCNTLARSNARPESDLDLFIVTAPGRIWLARLLVAGLGALLRLRPTLERSADRLCFSFFATTEALGLRRFAVEDDVYLAHWLHDLHPVYDEAGLARRVWTENAWVRERLPASPPPAVSSRRLVPPRLLFAKRRLERALDWAFGDRLEAWARRTQLRVMPAGLRRLAEAEGSAVVLSDDVLKFHDQDRREEIRDRYRARLRDFGLVAEDAAPAAREREASFAV